VEQVSRLEADVAKLRRESEVTAVSPQLYTPSNEPWSPSLYDKMI